MDTVEQVIDRLGRKAIANAVGVSETSVTNAKTRGFPSGWYLVVRELLSAKGEKCPEELFNFISNSQVL